MKTRVNARLIMVLLLVLAVFMSFRVGFAQDEGGDTSTEPGSVGDIAQAADNFNVPAVPTPEDENVAVLALARRLFKSPADLMNPQIQMRFQNEKMNLSLLRLVNQNIERVKSLMDGGGSKAKRMPLRQTPPGDILVQTTDDMSGDVMTVFTDYSVVMADAKEETFFEGYIAGESAETLMILGQDTDGNQYAISNGDAIGLTAGGDVFLGSGDHLYLYNYDEDGNFVSLTDSDGNGYDVETTDDGGFTITDASGDTGDFNPDGSYDIQDQAGNVLDQGALFGENDGDPVFGGDEYSGGSDYTGGGDDYSAGGD